MGRDRQAASIITALSAAHARYDSAHGTHPSDRPETCPHDPLSVLAAVGGADTARAPDEVATA